MNGICLIWSRGRLISPSLPVGDDRYLNLSSQKRPTGRNLGGNRSVRRSGTTSRGTVVLVFCLRMRSFPLTLVLTIFVGIIRASFLNMRADLSSSWLIRTSVPKSIILKPFCLTIVFVKCPKMAIPRHFLKCFLNIWIYLRLILFALFKSKITVKWM